jgi:hypothetical protein
MFPSPEIFVSHRVIIYEVLLNIEPLVGLVFVLADSLLSLGTMIKTHTQKQNMALHTCNSSTCETEQEDCEFEASFSYIVSFRHPGVHSETLSQKQKKNLLD